MIVIAQLLLLSLVFSVLASDCHLPWPFSCSSSNDHDKRKLITADVYDEIESIRVAGDIKGMSVAATLLSHDGNQIVLEADSWGAKTETGSAMLPATRFYLASVSKAFVAAAVGIVIDDFAKGRNKTELPPSLAVEDFNWQTKVKDLLPKEFSLMDDWAYEMASLRDALSHVSGLPR